MDQAYEAIRVAREENVGVLTLNRPDRLNAFNQTLMDEVIQALDDLESDGEVRAVVLHGAGRAFSSGFDIRGATDESKFSVAQWKARSEVGSWRYLGKIWHFPKPIVAAVHGYCLGGACELAMLCDVTVAASECQFGEPEIRFATGSPALIMPWVIPMKVAKELLLSGSTISAGRAYELGMVNEVVPAERLMARALYHARTMATVSPLAVRLMKESLRTTYEIMGLRSALAYNSNLSAILDGSETAEFTEFEQIRMEQGLRAALNWRDQQFRRVEEEYG